MSGPMFNPNTSAAALVGSGLSTYAKRDWLVDNKSTLQALGQMQTASAPTVAFAVRSIENGYVILHKVAEYFCDDFEKVAARVVALLAADAMDRANLSRPGQDEAMDALRYMMTAYPHSILPSESVVRITGAI